MQKLLIGREYPDDIIKEIESATNCVRIMMYDWRWYSNQPGSRIQNLSIYIKMALGVVLKLLLF